VARVVDLGESQNVIVVSDVHMRTLDEERTQIFCRFLNELPECDTLVLLGDIFDFINARQSFFYHYWSPVFESLKKIRSHGVQVVFIEGNHDYGFQFATCPEVKDCFDHCGDFWARLTHSYHGELLLLHSDDVVCPPSYRLFRGVVKSRLFQWLVSPIPGQTTHSLFARVASVSRGRDEYRALSREFLTDCVDDLLERQLPKLKIDPRMCVFGHIHVSLDDHRKKVRFLSGSDWFSAPGFIQLHASGDVSRHPLGARKNDVDLFRFADAPIPGAAAVAE
jgi:UDP-2,3-diacylglucosamine pyrophosphatase LpxH